MKESNDIQIARDRRSEEATKKKKEKKRKRKKWHQKTHKYKTFHLWNSPYEVKK